GNVFFARIVGAGHPVAGSLVFVVLIVGRDGTDEAAEFDTKPLKSHHVYKKDNHEYDACGPNGGLFEDLPTSIICTCLVAVEIRPDVALKMIRQLEGLFYVESLDAERGEKNGERREVLREPF